MSEVAGGGSVVAASPVQAVEDGERRGHDLLRKPHRELDVDDRGGVIVTTLRRPTLVSQAVVGRFCGGVDALILWWETHCLSRSV